MQHLPLIDTTPLFLPLSSRLIVLLNSLDTQDWNRGTACGPWTVKDVTAHLLGGNFGRLWPLRTAGGITHVAPAYEELLALINASNEQWVQAARRISPPMLIELLALTDQRLAEHFAALDPDAQAGASVAWAGESASRNWFDIAREYTEKWLHQQHIREAVGQSLLVERALCQPVFDTFLRGLPHALRHTPADDGAAIVVCIEGEAGDCWSALRIGNGWQLRAGAVASPAATVRIPQDRAWRLFTKGIGRNDAAAVIAGDQALGEACLELVAIMA